MNNFLASILNKGNIKLSRGKSIDANIKCVSASETVRAIPKDGIQYFAEAKLL